ncbi:MAG: acyl--CoA ligase [Burkholderiales bacterium]|nr:acyl--CoA ligase [Burkholderiales bacterium]
MAMTVDGLLSSSARRRPAQQALIAGGISLSYGELDAMVSRFARVLLAMGISTGERIGVVLPNSLEMVVAFYAASRAGAVFVPMNPAFTDRELQHILSDSEVKLAICRPSHRDRLEALKAQTGVTQVLPIADAAQLQELCAAHGAVPLVPPDDAITHSILYTSGTTGKPKGAVFSHFGRIYNSLTCQLGYRVHAETRMNCAPPMFHSGGMMLALLNVVGAGGTLLLPADAGPDSTRHALENLGANYLLTVPTIIRRLVDDAPFSAAARGRTFSILHGGAAMPPSLMEQMRQSWPQCLPFHAYGATEAPQLTVLPPEDYFDYPGALGRALPGMEVSVRRPDASLVAPGELGEITTSGPHVLDAYLNQPEATRERLRLGRFWTGDQATVDDTGVITIMGRSSDLIITGGLNVYAREVEDVLHACAGVRHAAVFALPDPEWGELVVAAIQAAPDAPATAAALEQSCREKLASYKRPKRFFFVEDLPLTPAGKVQKFRLVEKFS